METCGKGHDDQESEEMIGFILSGFSIGTPATRAETIKKLKDVGYITVQKKIYFARNQLLNQQKPSL